VRRPLPEGVHVAYLLGWFLMTLAMLPPLAVPVFGIHYARHCAGSCWAIMLGCALASHAVAVLACVQLIAMHERDARAPRFAAYALALMASPAIVAWPLISDR
jgi:predicted metal-binding membrane protein